MFQKKRQKVKILTSVYVAEHHLQRQHPQQREGPARLPPQEPPSSSAVSECLCRLCGSVSRRVLRRLLGKDFHSLLLGDLPPGIEPRCPA